MSLESDEKAYREGLKKWMIGNLFDKSAFEEWIYSQEISVIEFTHDIFLTNNWVNPCEFMRTVIKQKQLTDLSNQLN